LGTISSHRASSQNRCQSKRRRTRIVAHDLQIAPTSFDQERIVVSYPLEVRWRCQRCGMCCKDQQVHRRTIRLLEVESRSISKATEMSEDEFSRPEDTSSLYAREMLKREGECVFLKDHSCSIYRWRPLTCIFFPFYMKQISSKQLEIGLTNEPCSGLGLGHKMSEGDYKKLVTVALDRIRSSRPREVSPQAF